MAFQIVFAGTYKEFEVYRLAQGFSKAQVVYIRDDLDLGEFCFDPPVRMPVVGSFYNRWDATKIFTLAALKGIILTLDGDPDIYDPREVSANLSRYL
jgi:hypothetical protein